MIVETDLSTANVTPIRPLDEAGALAWLRSQPGGRTNLPAAELARRWGWQRYNVSRRLQRWSRDGLVARRGRTLTAIDVASAKAVAKAATNRLQHVDVPQEPAAQDDRSVAVHNAARDAAIVAAPESRHVARLVAVDGRHVDPPATVLEPAAPRHRRGGGSLISVATLMAALGLAGVSAWYSITGLTAIFVGAPTAVMALGVALECGKLAGVASLGRHGSASPWPLRAALTALVLAMMGLDVIGAYGFLAKAQIEHSVLGDAAIESRQVQAKAKLDAQAAAVADLDKRIGLIDQAVMEASLHGRSRGAMNIADAQKATRAELVRERQRQADVLSDMKAEAAGLSAQRRVAAADLGPVKYLAALVGVPADDMLRWFVLLVACLLDPAAVILLLVAASQGRNH